MPRYGPPTTARAKRKAELQIIHKPRVLARDGHACRACGSTRELELCHVTPAQTFERLEDSYDDANLLILCEPCHAAHEGRARSSTSIDRLVEICEQAKEVLFHRKEWSAAYETKALWQWAQAQRHREADARRAGVEAIFARVRLERGYTSADEYLTIRRHPALRAALADARAATRAP